MDWESSGVVGFDLGPPLQGQTRIAKLKSAYNSIIIGPRGLGWQTNQWEIMGWKSCGGRIWPWAPPSRSNEDSQT